MNIWVSRLISADPIGIESSHLRLGGATQPHSHVVIVDIEPAIGGQLIPSSSGLGSCDAWIGMADG